MNSADNLTSIQSINPIVRVTLNTGASGDNYNIRTNEINVRDESPLSRDRGDVMISTSDTLLFHNLESIEWISREIQNRSNIYSPSEGIICLDIPSVEEIVKDAEKYGVNLKINKKNLHSPEVKRLILTNPNHVWEDFSDLKAGPHNSEVRNVAKKLKDIALSELENVNPDAYHYAIVLHETTHASRMQTKLSKQAFVSYQRTYEYLADKSPKVLKELKEELNVEKFKLDSLYELEATISEIQAFEEREDQSFSSARYAVRLARLMNEFKVESQYDYSKLDQMFVHLIENNSLNDFDEHIYATVLLVLGEEHFDEYSDLLIYGVNSNTEQTAKKGKQLTSYEKARRLSALVIRKVIEHTEAIESGTQPIKISNSFYERVSHAIELKQLETIDIAHQMYLEDIDED